MQCQWCQKDFEPQGKHQRFCGTSCSAKWRMRQPEIRAAIYTEEVSNKISQRLKDAHGRNPAWAEASSQRMKINNPAKNPEIMEKIKQTFRRIGHGVKHRGGNGRSLPLAQRVLLEALGKKWIPEYSISLGARKPGYPTCYKVDLAFPILQIWIEVDGQSHCSKERQAQDIKKENALRLLGWTGLRFRNQQVLDHLQQCLDEIAWFTILR